MRLLLDTHVVLWWMDEPGKLSEAARDAIAEIENEVFVSSVAAWEIAIKRQLGKLSAPHDLRRRVSDSGFKELPISLEHGLVTEQLPLHHRDPFDRMLIAQARVESATIVTRDILLKPYGVPLIDA